MSGLIQELTRAHDTNYSFGYLTIGLPLIYTLNAYFELHIVITNFLRGLLNRIFPSVRTVMIPTSWTMLDYGLVFASGVGVSIASATIGKKVWEPIGGALEQIWPFSTLGELVSAPLEAVVA